MVYGGSTQRDVKDRLQEHVTGTRTLINTGKGHDSLSRHLAKHFADRDKVSRSEVRNMLKCGILWEGNKISTVKKFGTADCLLCGMEKYWILRLGEAEHGCINQNNDIYKSCPHRPRVLDLFAEDSVNDEKWTTKKI